MAWASKEEEAMDIIGKHMQVMSLKKKRELNEIYSKLIFPKQGLDWTDVKWTTQWRVTFMTMWDEEHLMKNSKFAMLQEMMGLGPIKYCIVYNEMPNFSLSTSSTHQLSSPKEDVLLPSAFLPWRTLWSLTLERDRSGYQ